MSAKGLWLASALAALLLLGSVDPHALLAQGSPSITITKPVTPNDIVPEADDFATTVIGNPWDMSETVPPGLPDVESTLQFDNTTVTTTGGVWHGVTKSAAARTAPAQLILLTRGYGQNQACCLGNIHWKADDGYISPLDPTKYHYATFRMKLTNAPGTAPIHQAQFYWYTSDSTSASVVSGSNGFVVSADTGYQTYTVDLNTLGILSGTPWNTTGIIKGFTFAPTNQPSVTVDLDWFRLLADPPATSNYTVSWQTANAPAGALVDLYCDTDTDPTNGTACSIAQNVPATQGSAVWNTFLQAPDTYSVQARMGTDYAALKRGDPWDMTAASDVTFQQISGTFGPGGLSGTTTGGDPIVILSLAGPIDTSVFKSLTLNIAAQPGNDPNPQIQITWRNSKGEIGVLPFYAARTAKSYTIDLSTDPKWTGTVDLLRVHPPSAANVPFQLGTVTLTPTRAAVGTNVTTTTSPGLLTINTAPQIQIVNPSTTSGPDFATTVLHDPWDLSNREDYVKVNNSSESLVGGILSGVSTAQPIFLGIPEVELNTRGTRINNLKYRFLTFRYSMDLTDPTQDNFDLAVAGWAARVIWWGPAGPPTDQCTSSWVAIERYAFNYTYTFDLATTPHEDYKVGDPNGWPCGPQGKAWADPANNVTAFRFDPHEVGPPTGWHLDDVKLTGFPEGIGSLTISWTLQKANTSQPTTVNLFYSPTNDGQNLTPITTITDDSRSYVWDTSNIPPSANNTYYVVARISDGLNTIQRVSSSPFTTIPITSVCDPRPNLSVQSTASGDGRLLVKVTASGPSSPLLSITFDSTSSALIDIPGPGGRTGSKGSFTQAMSPGALSYSFFLRRAAAGQPATAPFTVVDSCGGWHSLAGGGASAPF